MWQRVSGDGRGAGSYINIEVDVDIGRGARIGRDTSTDASGVGRASFTNHHVVRPRAYG
jgi:hypothetical protein